MISIISKVKKKRIFTNILTLTTGSAIVQVIGVLLSPIISRLYTPESFGIVGVIIATASIVSAVGSLKFELAIVLEKNDNFANTIESLCYKILAFITLLFILFLFLSTVMFNWFKFDGQLQYIWFSVPIMIGMSMYNILKERLNRKMKYKLLASAAISQKLSNNLLQILMGILGANALGLIVGNIFGIIISLALIIISEKILFLKPKGPKKLPQLLCRKYYKFPLYSAPQNALNSISQQLPIYLLGYFYGAEVVGFYWFAMKFIQIPSSLVSNSILQVFYKEAALIKNNLYKLKRLYLKFTTNLALIIILPTVIFFFIAPWFFSFIFGEQWIIAGEYAKWMFIWISVGFINPPSVTLFNVLNNQNVFLKYEIMLISFRALSLILGGYLGLTALNTIILYSAVGTIFNSGLILASYFINLKKKMTTI